MLTWVIATAIIGGAASFVWKLRASGRVGRKILKQAGLNASSVQTTPKSLRADILWNSTVVEVSIVEADIEGNIKSPGSVSLSVPVEFSEEFHIANKTQDTHLFIDSSARYSDLTWLDGSPELQSDVGNNEKLRNTLSSSLASAGSSIYLRNGTLQISRVYMPEELPIEQNEVALGYAVREQWETLQALISFLNHRGGVFTEIVPEPDARCPFCRDPLLESVLARCSMCRTISHQQCWVSHGSCSLYGCTGSPLFSK